MREMRVSKSEDKAGLGEESLPSEERGTLV